PVFTLDMPMERIINLLKCPCDFPLTPRISYNLTTYRIRVSLIGTYGDFLATICQKCSLPFFVISSGISILTIGIKLIPFKHIRHLASFLTTVLYSGISRTCNPHLCLQLEVGHISILPNEKGIPFYGDRRCRFTNYTSVFSPPHIHISRPTVQGLPIKYGDEAFFIRFRKKRETSCYNNNSRYQNYRAKRSQTF